MDDPRQLDPDVVELKDYLKIVLRNWLVIAAAAIAVFVAALAFSLAQDPVYETRAEFVVQTPAEGSSEEQVLFGTAGLATQARVITSRPIVEQVMRDNGLPYEDEQAINRFLRNVEVRVGEGDVVELLVRDEQSDRAAAVARSFTGAYVERLQAGAEERAEIEFAALDKQERAAQAQIQSFKEQLAGVTGATRDSLEEERDQLYARLRRIEERRAGLEVALDSTPELVDVIQPAFVPNAQVSPRPARTGALALVLGGLLGIGFALIREWGKPRIHEPDDVTRATGLPVLAQLQAGERGKGRADGYGVLRASVRAALGRPEEGDDRGHVVQVAAVEGHRSASVVALELARSFARAGHRVVVVDADLGRSGIGELHGYGAAPGLVEVLNDQISLADALRGSVQDGVLSLPSGDASVEQVELLSSRRMQRIVDDLRSLADVVILSSSGILGSAQTLELGSFVDGTVVLAAKGETVRDELLEATQRLARADAVASGAVLSARGVLGQGPTDGQAVPSPAAASESSRGRSSNSKPSRVP